MTPAFVVEITTPKKYRLNGLWFGPKKPKRVIVFIHGLTGSAFSGRRIVDALVDTNTAVMTFNNRGHGVVNRLRVGERSVLGGGAHEVFTESSDDIRGAVLFARRSGAKEIYIAGHSTGCQKAVYYASKFKKRSLIRGLILLGPVSDYAAALKDDANGRLKKATALAKSLVRAGKKHVLLPSEMLTPWSVDDAQRFLSLYTPDSKETIFPYEQKGKVPRTLRSVAQPILVLWAAKDPYADRPAKDIAAWFTGNLKKHDKVVVVPRVEHGFKGGEKTVAAEVRRFMHS